jgi:hypothetical protein
MITSHTTRSIEDYLNDFAGRQDMEGYDETKTIRVAEENRDFVWTPDMCKELIVSIFAGYTIPLMVICDNQLMDGGNRSTALMLWRQNRFTVRFGEWEGNYDAMAVNPTLSGRWNRCMIPLTIITHATREERAQIYENYNKGIVLSTGQLLKNRRYRPLVQMALSMIGRGDNALFPFRDLIMDVWKRTWKRTKTLNELAFAYQVIVGSMFGPDFFHTKFHLHLDRLMTTEFNDIDLTNLQRICELIDSVDPENVINRKKKESFFKKFIGAMIYDLHTQPWEVFVPKWSGFCRMAYATMTPEQLKRVIDVKSSRANNFSRLRQLSQNVSEFLVGNIHGNDEPETDDDSDTDTE